MNPPGPDQCQCCGKPIPADLLELGGTFCSHLCEHIVTKCGTKTGRCIICGDPLPPSKNTGKVRPDRIACARHRDQLQLATSKYTYRRKLATETPEQRRIRLNQNRKTVQRQNALVKTEPPTPYEVREKFHDDAVRKGIWSLEFEVELVFAEASRLRGTHDHFLRNKTHVEGPEEPTPMKNLHCFRKEARHEAGEDDDNEES